MKKWTLGLAVAVAAGLAVAAAAASSGNGGVHEHLRRMLHGHAMQEEAVGAHLDAMASMLELTTPQRQQVAGVLTTALPDVEAKAITLIQAHSAQVAVIHAAQLDEEALGVASAQVGQAQAALALCVARTLHGVHAVLTPEQLERAQQLHGAEWLTGFTEHVHGVGEDIRSWAARQ